MVKAARFLNPKADVVFKKVFGCHKNLLMSFLNAIMPLPKGKIITSLEYLSSEQVPVIPGFKRTIVDVKCWDQDGHYFIVEMQMEWADSFMSRILYGSCQAYVSQLEKGGDYASLAPVYALGLINESFDKSDEFYHHYKLRHATQEHKTLNGLEIVLIELQKFKPNNDDQRQLRSLWIRFLNETEKLIAIPEEFKAYPELIEAMELTQESGYTRSELDYYNSYWDSVSCEKTLMTDAYGKGLEKGKSEGKAEGFQEGIEKGIQEGKLETAKKMKDAGLSIEDIAKFTGLSLDDLNHLYK
ncbi:MAG: hypothetical protein NEHIOOID_00523 [Holosporales bacterium]